MEEILRALSEIGNTNEKWNKLYKERDETELYDWYADWSKVGEILLRYVPSTSKVLIPGCGDSDISENLYRNGVKNIINIDFSKDVIAKMKRRCKEMPAMSWLNLNMTGLAKFTNKTFDAVIDKAGLDALTVLEVVPTLGRQYLSEVRRVLKNGGKFICFTHAKPQALGLLFRKFRYGFQTSVVAVPRMDKPDDKQTLQVLMVIIEKVASTTAACGLYEALDQENILRSRSLIGDEIMYSLDDLLLGVQGDLSRLSKNRRIELTLGEQEVDNFFYKSIIFDSMPRSPQQHHCTVLLVPKRFRALSSEEELKTVKKHHTSRLIMVFLEARHDDVSPESVKKELEPLVKQLEPLTGHPKAEIIYKVHPDESVKTDLHKVTVSNCIGGISVKDVVIQEEKIRSLTYARADRFEQFVMLNDTSLENKSSDNLVFDHGDLVNDYHLGIISGFVLISSYLKKSKGAPYEKVKVVIDGLGTGLLPMYIRKTLDYMQIEVLERTHILQSIAEEHFGFSEDNNLKIHRKEVLDFVGNLEPVDILIIDVPSINDTWHVLVCPPSALVEQSFFERVKSCLNKQGLFILNLVMRSPAHKYVIYSRMKEVFPCVFCWELTEGFHEILYGCCSEGADLDKARIKNLQISESLESEISIVLDEIIQLK